MKKISYINEEASRLHQDQTVSDLKFDLEKRLMAVRSDSDVSELLSKVNRILQMPELSSKNKTELKNLRQKAYDRKRKLQILADEPRQQEISTPQVQTQSRNHQDLHQDVKRPKFLDQDLDEVHQENFSGIKIFKNLDVESILKKIPALIVFASCAFSTLWFVWWQSIPLYESTGFGDPKLCAFGALLMIGGFSVIHAMTRSKLVLLLCLFASSYEVVLIVNGTVKNETQISAQAIIENPEIVWLKQQVEHENKNYQKIKTQYENPSSKVFQNSWFKANHLDPSWQKYSSAQEKLSEKIGRLSSESSSWDHIGMLKILYRLGLVFLCMISIHHLLKCFQSQDKSLRKKSAFA